MPIEKAPPPPPAQVEHPAAPRRGQAPIADRRSEFERKTPQTAAERAEARAFIDGKIEMIRRDPRLSDAEKAAAIAELQSRR